MILCARGIQSECVSPCGEITSLTCVHVKDVKYDATYESVLMIFFPLDPAHQTKKERKSV